MAVPTRFRLVHGSLDVELAPGLVVIGRDAACEIPVDDPLASRRHAQLRVDESSATITDLGSANGTWVNGERLTGTRALAGGDWITIAGQEYQLVDARTSKTLTMSAVATSPPSSDRADRSPTSYRHVNVEARAPKSAPPGRATLPLRSMSRDELGLEDPQEATAQVNTFQLFGKLAENALAAGESARAEQILSAQFRAILDGARRGTVAVDAADFMARYAVRLASVTGKATWLDALVKVFTVARRPLPAGVIEELQATLRKFPEVDRAALHDYVEVLRASTDKMGPAERLAVQRIASLEQLLGPRGS